MSKEPKRNYKKIILYGKHLDYEKLRLLLLKKGVSVSEWFREKMKDEIKNAER